MMFVFKSLCKFANELQICSLILLKKVKKEQPMHDIE